MTLTSLQSDIIDQRIANNAAVTFDDYTFRAKLSAQLSPGGQHLEELAAEIGISRAKLIAFRQSVRETTERCNAQLAREGVVVYTLNEARDRVVRTDYVSKQEACDRTGFPGGELFDLDKLHGGLLVRGSYIFASEAAIEDGLKRYSPATLLNGLINERL